MEELVKRLESVDTQESAQAVGGLQKRLGGSREPQLLNDLIDYYMASGSPRALKVLSSLKDVQSQDFLSKLNDCMHSKWPLRLPVLRLLAHCLNKQTSWLYKIVQHPLFMTILHYLKVSHDVVVLTSGVLVLAAILPLSPSHLSRHLPDIFQIFSDLATVRTTHRLRLVPKQLYLHLDVAVYYLFLQLYALFPHNFFTFLRGRYGPTGERSYFFQYIAPLFNFVKFHPGLVTDSNAIETHEDKWRHMEPDEVATLSLALCFDLSIACPDPAEEGSETSSSNLASHTLYNWEPTSLTDPHHNSGGNGHQPLPLTNSLRIIIPPEPLFSHPPLSDSSSSVSGTLPSSSNTAAQVSSCHTSNSSPSPVKGVSPRNTRRQLPRGTGRKSETVCGTIRDVQSSDRAVTSANNVLASGHEMMWSPSVAFDPSLANNSSHHHTQTTGHASAITTPSPENSAYSASVPGTAHHTPRPMTAPTFTYMNYSPTASLRSEHALSRQPSLQTTPSSSRSATRQSSLRDGSGGDPFVTAANRLSRSLYSSSSTGRAVGSGVRGTEGNHSMPPQSATIRDRFEKFFSLFSRKSARDNEAIVEPFTEVSPTDMSVQTSGAGWSHQGAESGVGVVEEVGIEADKELPVRDGGEQSLTHNNSSPQLGRDGQGEIEDENSSNESTTTEVPPNMAAAVSVSASHSPVLAASFPGGGGRRDVAERRRGVGRQRASHSDSVSHTVHQVRERLWELAESQKMAGEESCSLAEEKETQAQPPGDEATTAAPAGGSAEVDSSATYPGHVPGPIQNVDSSLTLVGSLSSSSVFSSQQLASVARSLDANQTGESPLPISSSSLRERRGSGLVMRKVSVCDHRSTGNGVSFGTQTSLCDSDHTPSPVVLLDRLVTHGEMVHRGNPRDIPLTELEDVDWFRYGGCPHGEELGQLQSQVALLHSQLLFERHRCLQHDRRSRRLLSQVRSAHRVREELERLRSQCWRETVMRRSLEQHIQEAGQASGGERAARERRERLADENRALSEKNQDLERENQRLTLELATLKQENEQLTKEAKETRERVFVLESEQSDMRPRLAQTHSLREKAAALERELLVVNRLYQSQREELQTLVARSQGRQQWELLSQSLRREKEAAERERARLVQETKGLKMIAASLKEEKRKAAEEISELQQILFHVQGRCKEKIKASEEKYEAMVAVAHQLENHLTELRAHTCPPTSSGERPSPDRHRHSQSTVHKSTSQAPEPAATPSSLATSSPSLRTV